MISEIIRDNLFKRLFLVFVVGFIGSMPSQAIKIGLQTQSKEIKIAVSADAEIYDFNKKEPLCQIKPMKIYKFQSKGNKISVINSDKKEFNLGTNTILIKTKKSGYLWAKKSWYKGDFIIYNIGSFGLTLINNVPLEEYLKGVVPSEMPSKWNTEALKAQAIAARSYAVATKNAGKHASKGFDLVDTTADQVYGGVSVEKKRTTKAVEDTKGIVLVQDKRGVLPTYYHASSGGQTKIWSSGSSFLQSVPSVDGNVKKNGHGVGMSQYGANNLAEKGWDAYQILMYFYKDFKFAKLSDKWDI